MDCLDRFDWSDFLSCDQLKNSDWLNFPDKCAVDALLEDYGSAG